MKVLSLVVLALIVGTVNPHTVEICYDVDGSSVDLYAGTYHSSGELDNNGGASGGVILGGVRYDFTHYVPAPSFIPPDGSSCSLCPNYGPGHNGVQNWQVTTANGLSDGTYTVTTTTDTVIEWPWPGCSFPNLNIIGIQSDAPTAITDAPVPSPSQNPSHSPIATTANPTPGPTDGPTTSPSQSPTTHPTDSPTGNPTGSPTCRDDCTPEMCSSGPNPDERYCSAFGFAVDPYLCGGIRCEGVQCKDCGTNQECVQLCQAWKIANDVSGLNCNTACDAVTNPSGEDFICFNPCVPVNFACRQQCEGSLCNNSPDSEICAAGGVIVDPVGCMGHCAETTCGQCGPHSNCVSLCNTYSNQYGLGLNCGQECQAVSGYKCFADCVPN